MDEQKEKALSGSAQGQKGKAEWQANIVAFLCNWCSYAGADLSGTSRLRHNPQIRVIRVPCSGKVDPLFLIRAFADGADGVLVSGCHPGDCHYSTGNYYARRKFALLKRLMEFLGMDERRIHFSWVSAAEGAKWSKVVNEVIDSVYEAGPFPGFDNLDSPEEGK